MPSHTFGWAGSHLRDDLSDSVRAEFGEVACFYPQAGQPFFVTVQYEVDHYEAEVGGRSRIATTEHTVEVSELDLPEGRVRRKDRFLVRKKLWVVDHVEPDGEGNVVAVLTLMGWAVVPEIVSAGAAAR